MVPLTWVAKAVIGAGALSGLASLYLHADDSAAAIAAGGLVPRRETRIVMAKEVLKISPKKVVVDYDFRNDTDEDVTTEVAFPVPPYVDGPNERGAALESFSHFKLIVDGATVRFNIEAKALLGNKDVTRILETDHIDIPSFGHNDSKKGILDLNRLPKSEQARLVHLGLFDLNEPIANWTVRLQYHWSQIFPAHSTTHIRHEYTPVVGFTQVWRPAVEALLERRAKTDDLDQVQTLKGFCADRQFLTTLERAQLQSESEARSAEDKLTAGVSYPKWVDFVLTTANTWQEPIEDFTLIIERPDSRTLISLCSPANSRVEKVEANHFQVHLTNFIPKSELHIGFFDLPVTKMNPAAKKTKIGRRTGPGPILEAWRLPRSPARLPSK